MSEQVFYYRDYIVEVEPYPSDGSQVRVRLWDGTDWDTLYNRRVIADNWYEMLTGALVDVGLDWEDADWAVNEWGIYPPDDEDENGGN
jgi:hypothetical protein